MGGGIDPETGYSRRAMNVFHNFDFENKIKITTESFDKNFIAGKIMSNKKNIFTNNSSRIWFIIGMFTILIVLVIIIILNYKN